ncbi:site-specific DNA-methyltransferase [Aliarcobacter cryaerophilus]|uniref:site-specific DNA-methyltransferase n=1 Tax=Aliarcobacter cryaerophilus TaxID=28198 RepID=UPI003DA48D6E
MIYIDPPYNTGKDFVYKDNFRDNIKNYLEITGQVDSDGNKLSTNSETSGRYHSDWLNMMYPRLKLARNLLKDDGVIFISIDDNEVSNLRKLCDEIFGEDNFVSSLIFQSNSIKNNAKQLSTVHEYCLVYCKNISIQENWRIVLPNSKKLFTFFEKLKKFSLSDEERIKRIKEFIKKENITGSLSNYTKIDDKGLFRLDNIGGVKNGNTTTKLFHPLTKKECKMSNGGWRYSQEKLEKLLKENMIYFGENEETVPQIKRYLDEEHLAVFNSVIYKDTSQDFKKVDELLNGNNIFDFPKNIDFIVSLLELIVSKEKDSLILDFFSGSATTAHAIMKLNSEDDGNRKFICVQLPENTDEKSEAYKAGYKNICEIGKERIRRAGEKVKSESGKTELDIGFKVLKLDSSNIKSWDSDFENLETNLLDAVENIKSDRNEEDLVYEILLKYGLDLALPIEELNINGKKIFSIGFGSLVCCLDNDIDTNIVEKIAELKKQFETDFGLENMRVVFKDSSFKDSVVKTNALQILKQNGINEVVSI